MRHSIAIGLLLAACSPQEPGNDVDIGNAARAAKSSSDRYAIRMALAKARSEKARAPSPAPSPPPSPSPNQGLGSQPAAAGSAQDAAMVARTYFAAIRQKNYAAAWKLWDRDGAASGMSSAAFAASFDKYADYRADVGTPGRIDSGAGQRYVTIPVTVDGTLRSGKPFAMEGPITLHRAADIDGATAEQRRWRISDSALRPRPAKSPD